MLSRLAPGIGRLRRSNIACFEAAGEAHRQTGAPVACHLEMGTAAWEVLKVLEIAGVPSHRVMLSHVDRNPDPGLHVELAAAGAYIGYDGMARARLA